MGIVGWLKQGNLNAGSVQTNNNILDSGVGSMTLSAELNFLNTGNSYYSPNINMYPSTNGFAGIYLYDAGSNLNYWEIIQTSTLVVQEAIPCIYLIILVQDHGVKHRINV